MWDLKQRNFFCVRLRPHSLWTQAGKRSTLGCGCRDSLYTGLGGSTLIAADELVEWIKTQGR